MKKYSLTRYFFIFTALAVCIAVLVVNPFYPLLRGFRNELEAAAVESFKKNPKNNALKKELVDKISEDAHKKEFFQGLPLSGINLNIAEAKFGSEPLTVFIVDTGSKNSLVAIYQNIDGTYKFLSSSDFFDIQSYQIIPLGSEDNLLLIREFVDQMTGAFEKGTHIRCYEISGGKLRLVLNILEDYKAFWNSGWDKNSTQKPAMWKMVSEKTSVSWNNRESPVVTVLKAQNLMEAKGEPSDRIPEITEFDTVKTRQLAEKYYWSDKWRHFIICEAVDLKTGEEVAVLEFLKQSPFQLDNELDKNLRIKKNNGEIEIVPENRYKLL